MHCTRRAPELSATSRLVCIWIIWFLPTFGNRLSSGVPGFRLNWGWGSGRSLGHHRPAFRLRDGGAFLDADHVAHLEFVLRVMGAVLLRLPHGLLQQRMLEAAFDQNGDRLLVLVRGDDALQDTFGHFV